MRGSPSRSVQRAWRWVCLRTACALDVRPLARALRAHHLSERRPASGCRDRGSGAALHLGGASPQRRISASFGLMSVSSGSLCFKCGKFFRAGLARWSGRAPALMVVTLLSSCAAEEEAVTYSENIRPIFDQRCVICHLPQTSWSRVDIQNPYSTRPIPDHPEYGLQGLARLAEPVEADASGRGGRSARPERGRGRSGQ